MKELNSQQVNIVSGGSWSWFTSAPKPTSNVVIELSTEHFTAAAVCTLGFIAGTFLGVMAEKKSHAYGQMQYKAEILDRLLAENGFVFVQDM